MGNYVSAIDRATKACSEVISHCQIEKDSKKFREEYNFKILLLGTSESGKSTIVNQMKIVYGHGFTNSELVTFHTIIYHNTLDSAQAIILQMHKMNMECIKPTNRVFAERIIEYRIEHDPNFVFSADIAQAIHEIWQDHAIQKVMDCASEFYLMDSASYFFTEVLCIGTPDYIPTENDVLRAGAQTTGVTKTRFQIGWLSSQRKQWIHCFESVNTIVFCASLVEYDQVLLEEKTQNRMAESLDLFDTSPIETYFPEYTGGADTSKAVQYILHQENVRVLFLPYFT
ncbi:heterotrimeric G protein alpha subunit [Suillus paluster]|uniref:heterotrimeric G protein alpha subunit n=1 Tax=Suillus paluster TaxID=48578 RepID=UPI001B876A9B|nr:heterotrimeric G protein alpha subunit [Suillus paluster]KAG1733084.1 heterotrimeric G protein alpha subunit [Suillus paluster]